ncbi:vanadium-dependent haloperoxidase [Larkinella terrae]|uniref:Phosphatase PAP2 family protein n=1 Tax=Larkinella terrae TaxID=2025311 RepID=A0A7K0ER01_9BACT|nr:vanadium-dependent haloperoxidase [Larkinella terrae]MRS64227.1 phosphatase PAP2 family protein [Larkinella terrae]
MKKIFLSLLLLFVVTSCGQEKTPDLGNREITKVISEMTEVMIHDVTNPPLAARFFTYACLAGYEVVSQNDKSCRSMHGVLNDYPEIEKPQAASGFSTHLSAVLAMLKTAQKIQPSGKRLETLEKQILDSCRTVGFSDDVIENSTHYALEISKQILKYAKADKYNRISNYPRYTPSGKPGTWYPTPPGYFAPVEPYFKTVRPFTLDSASQFKPAPPTPYSTDKKSAFYQLLEQNYKEDGTKLPDNHRQIAAFWDCNPFALENNGHMMVGLKKISPGAHWLGITGIACAKASKSFAETMKIYTAVAIGLTDGFICCWDEKYRSDRVRPETAIRKLIDQSWKPFLQTPPFPEYLSGHSTISSVSEVILTHYFGDNFAYTDTVEERYGLKARSFRSFREAAIEAGISRFYGGIHFMDAIDNGRAQGLKVGEWVVKKLN